MVKKPELAIGDNVICKITKVLNYGVFVEMLEYGNMKGFIHISNVASGWIKNIRNFVSEGQVRVAKVISIYDEKNQIDLSLTKVSGQDQRRKLEEYRQSKRSQMLIERLAKQTHSTFDAAWQEAAVPLIEEYGTLYEAFQNIALDGQDAITGVDKKWVKPLAELVASNIPVPEKTVKGTLVLKSFAPDGVEIIKGALMAALGKKSVEKIGIKYFGNARYQIKATSYEFKSAEKAINSAVEGIKEYMNSRKGTAEFEKAAQ